MCAAHAARGFARSGDLSRHMRIHDPEYVAKKGSGKKRGAEGTAAPAVPAEYGWCEMVADGAAGTRLRAQRRPTTASCGKAMRCPGRLRVGCVCNYVSIYAALVTRRSATAEAQTPA